jgi:hypothetical protein
MFQVNLKTQYLGFSNPIPFLELMAAKGDGDWSWQFESFMSGSRTPAYQIILALSYVDFAVKLRLIYKIEIFFISCNLQSHV